ncbi:MAG: heavy-metal-associated domain-containing protein [Phycisphaerales bacterium JB040]
MKTFSLAVLCSGISFVLLGCASSSPPVSGGEGASGDGGAIVAQTNFENFPDEPVAGDTATLTVTGMSCPMCSTNLELELMDHPMIGEVTINLETSSVVIGFVGRSHPTQLELANLVHDAGYTLVAIN